MMFPYMSFCDKKQAFCFQPGYFLIFFQFQPQIFVKCFLNFLKLLITITDDNLVQPKGLPNYQVPPVSSLDPTLNSLDDQELYDEFLPNIRFLTSTVFSSLLFKLSLPMCLKCFLTFGQFQPHVSYRHVSYIKEACSSVHSCIMISLMYHCLHVCIASMSFAVLRSVIVHI